MNRYKGGSTLERKAVVETPSLTSFDTGIINQGFDAFTRGQVPSPSFFYIDNTGGWLDSNGRPGPRRFTESWIELEQAYSCGDSSSSTSRCTCCRCCRRCVRFLVYAIIAICLLGFAAVIAAILYMEVFHGLSDHLEPESNFTAYTTAPGASDDHTLAVDIVTFATNLTARAFLGNESLSFENSTIRST
jgi:hypothetical protein